MATRKLTMEQDRAVVALMRTTYSAATGKTWVFPTDASVKLEREFNGAADAARERVAKMKAAMAGETPVEPVGYSTVAVETQVAIPVEVAPVVEEPVRTASAPVYKLFSACATKQHSHCTGAHFESNGERVVCTCKHHRQSDMFTAVKSVQAGFSFLK